MRSHPSAAERRDVRNEQVGNGRPDLRQRVARTICLFFLFASSLPGFSQDVSIMVLEPLENGDVVFQALAPSKIGDPKKGRISISMRITNQRSQPIAIDRIEILGQVASAFGAPVTVDPTSSYTFQNCRCDDSRPVLIAEPFPATAQIAVFLAGESSPLTKTVAIRPHTNDGGPLAYPGKANDLRVNETWGASSNHWSGHQVFALDMGVLGWNESEWSEKFIGVDGTERQHYRVYGMPVYAMADGIVCWALNDHQERPAIAAYSTISPSQGRFFAGGNQIYVTSSDEVALYAHLQPGSIPKELLTPGVSVTKGQYLGKVGLSGATSHPHIHIHVKREVLGPGVTCDAGPFRPMTFENLQSLTLTEADVLAQEDMLEPSSWTALTNHSAPHEYGLLYPSADDHIFCKNCTDSEQYIGVWRAGEGIDLRVDAAGWGEFTSKWEELSNDGFRLVEINTFVENSQRRFLGVFKRGGGGYFLWNVPRWDDFTEKWSELSKSGLRLVDLATYKEGSARHYVGVFLEGSDRHFLWSITGWENFTQKWAELSSDNLRLIDLETFPTAGTSRQYVGVFREGSDAHALWSITGWSAFTEKWDELSQNGLRLVDVETFPVGSERQFLGVFREGRDAYALYSTSGYQSFIQASEALNADGLRLIDVHVEE